MKIHWMMGHTNMDDNGKFIITQNGFIAVNNEQFAASEQFDNLVKFDFMKMGQPIVLYDKPFAYNVMIDELYEKSSSNTLIYKDLEFREQILIAVFSCFGTTKFSDWCDLQARSSGFTSSHKLLLNDTFRFICTGERTVSIESQQRLIDVRKADLSDDKVSYDAVEYFDDSKYNRPYNLTVNWLIARNDIKSIPFGLAEAICKWTSQEGGWSDLLIFCNIVFGRNRKPSFYNKPRF